MESNLSRRKAMAGVALTLLVVSFLAGPPLTAAGSFSGSLVPGKMAPDSALLDSQRTEIRMSEFAHGKYLMLDFYIGSFCRTCMTQPVQRQPMDTLEDLKRARDPLCGMKVDTTKRKDISRYEGKKYCFCPGDCEKVFDIELEKYL